MDTHVGIPTYYKGTRFRSRLEARWAHFFDLIQWRWEYEPFDMNGYIPDFLILGRHQMLVEIKPFALLTELITVAEVTPRAGRDLLALGCTPLPEDDVTDGYYGWQIGAMCEWWPDQPDVRPIAGADWHECRECGRYACHHNEQSFQSRPCGHYEGDHLLVPVDVRDIEAKWAQARNLTQWNPAVA